MIDDSTAKGIEVAMIRVERQLPRNSRIIKLVRAAAITPSLITPETAAFTNRDWSFRKLICKAGGSAALSVGKRALTPSMIAKVDAEPLLRMLISTVWAPLMRARFCW